MSQDLSVPGRQVRLWPAGARRGLLLQGRLRHERARAVHQEGGVRPEAARVHGRREQVRRGRRLHDSGQPDPVLLSTQAQGRPARAMLL